MDNSKVLFLEPGGTFQNRLLEKNSQSLCLRTDFCQMKLQSVMIYICMLKVLL